MIENEVTHASKNCPLWQLNVPEGVQFYPDQELLSVGVVHSDLPVEKQIVELDAIKKLAVEACAACVYHILKPPGSCEPGGYYRGGMVSTLAVNQRDEIPQEIKETPIYHYSDL